MRTRAWRLPLELAICSAVACGAPRPAPPTRSATIAPSASASASSVAALSPSLPASPARWITATVDASFSRTAFGTTLYFAGDGTRWAGFARPADPVEIGLAPEPIVAAFASGGGLVMLGASSAAYLTRTPLGPIVERRPPMRAGAVVAGRAAAFAVAGGELWRFADPAMGWTKLAFALEGRVLTQVGANAEGIVLALAAPQRAFVSGDDGVRFDRIDAPLAVRALSLRNGSIVVDGLERRGSLPTAPTLRASSFALTGEPPHFELSYVGGTAARTPTRAQPPNGLAHAAAGARGGFLDARWLELQPLDHGARLLAQPLDGSRTPKLLQVLATCDAPLLATAAPSTVAIACRRGAKTGLLRSEDRGASFVEVGTVVGRLAALAISGSGLLLARCEGTSTPCRPTLFALRDRREQAIEGGDALDALGPLVALPDGRAFALGVRRGHVVLASMRRERVGTATDASSESMTLSPTAGDLDPRAVASARLGVVDGALRSIAARAHGRWALQAPSGGLLTPRALPGDVDGLAIAGARALAWTTRRQAWESDDAGAHWTAVEVPALTGEAACGTHGCVFDAWTTRLGWSLPNAPALVVEAPPRVRRLRTARALRCVAAPTATPLGRAQVPFDVDANVDLDANVRFARVMRNDARDVTVVSGRGGKLSFSSLLERGNLSSIDAQGAAAARWEWKAKGGVETTIAWWSPRGGAGSARYASDRVPQLVGASTRGAFAFEGGSRVRLVSTAGATQLLTYEGPANAIAYVDADPKAPRLLATDGRFAYATDGTDDGLLGAWAAGPSLPLARVRALADATTPFVLTFGAGAAVPATTFWLAPPSHDPNAATFTRGPTALDVADLSRACAASLQGRRLVLPPVPGARRAIVIEGGGALPASGYTLASTDVVARVDAAGSACLSTIVAEGAGVTAIVPAGDLSHGWLLTDGPSGQTARGLACAPSDAPLPASLHDVEGFYEESFAP